MRRGGFTETGLWAVYERLDGVGCVIYRLRRCPDGTYEPVIRFGPLISPLPLSVHSCRSAAVRAAACVKYACAGTA